MEILGVILMIVVYACFGQIIRAFLASISAGWRTVTHGGSFRENFGTHFLGMGPFEIKGERNPISDELPFEVLELKGRGLIPIKKKTNIQFVTSVIDITDNEVEPVLAALDDFQELATRAFQHTVQGGQANPETGFIGWVRVGAIIPSLLVPPYSGRRTLVAVTRIIDADNPPSIDLGFSSSDHPGLLASFQYRFEENFTDKGYQEEAAHRVESRTLTIMLAVQVAMADGSFGDDEGNTIKDWIARSIDSYSEERKEELKATYNKALRDGYTLAQEGNLSISEVTSKLNSIATKSQKYEALDLCFDIMAADGVASEEELNVIKNISQALSLDFNEIQKMKDQRLIKLSTKVENQSSAEAILGIDSEWTVEQIQKHLRTEFTKWNGRLNTLSDGDERVNAQRMLDLIAEARKKYGAQS